MGLGRCHKRRRAEGVGVTSWSQQLRLRAHRRKQARMQGLSPAKFVLWLPAHIVHLTASKAALSLPHAPPRMLV